MHCTKHITDDLIWIGGNDRRLALFEGVYPIPHGVSYNSYVLLDESTVLIDTADQAIAPLFFENLEHALGGRELNFFIVQHMEPDHAALIKEITLRHPEAVIVCNEKIANMINQFFGMDVKEKAYIVNEGSFLCTGKHNLTFVNAPMVHWPEVMVTYDTVDKILFSADAFGTFGAQNGALFADEVDFEHDYLHDARIYFTNIVGKYGPQVQKVLGKAAGLEIKLICPLHGFVWRKDLGYLIEKYLLWSSYTPEENGVVIAYGSIYGNTENATEVLASALRQRGLKTYIYDVSVTHPSEILAACFRYSHLVFACPTYNNGLYTPMETLLHELVAHNLQNRVIALVENGTWTPSSAKNMRAILEGLKNTTFVDPVLTVKSALKEAQLETVNAMADAIAATVKIPEPVKEVVSEDVDKKVLNNISYGLYVCSTHDGKQDTACIINTPVQISSDPLRIAISVNKANYTNECIASCGIFNLSILAEDVDFGLIKHFGFQSGRDVFKYENCDKSKFSKNGLRYTTFGTNGFISCKVVSSQDMGSHTLFIAEVTEAAKLRDVPSVTYDYYHKNIKPQPEAKEKKGYVCNICGYIHEGDELPEDFICPICKHPASDFRPL